MEHTEKKNKHQIHKNIELIDINNITEEFIVKDHENYKLPKKNKIRSEDNYNAFVTLDDSNDTMIRERDYSNHLEELNISKIIERNKIKIINDDLNDQENELISNVDKQTKNENKNKNKGKVSKPPKFFIQIAKKSFSNKQKININKEQEYVINNIETIYSFMEKNTSKLSIFLFILFLISTVNMMIFWGLNYMIAEIKTNYYCFDYHTGEFYQCAQNDFCKLKSTSIFNLIYTKNKNLTNEDEKLELYNINKHFKSILLFDLVRFSSWNRLKNSKMVPTIHQHVTVIAINKGEDYNIFSFFNLVCNNQTTLFLMGITMIIGLFFFALVAGCFADIFGRKKILIFLVSIQIIGIVLFIGLEEMNNIINKNDNLVIIKKNKNNKFQNKFDIYNQNLNCNVTMMNSSEIKNISSSSNTTCNNDTSSFESEYFFDPNTIDDSYPLSAENYLDPYNINYMTSRQNDFIFDIYDFDENFQKKFYFLEKKKNETFNRRKYFFDMKSLFSIVFLLTFTTVPGIFNLCLSYFMELSFNLSSSQSNYNFFSKSYVFSYLFSYYLIVPVNNLSISIGIIGLIQFILILVFNYLDIESPRYCYEVSDWVNLTKTMREKLIDDNFVDDGEKIWEKIVRNKEDPIYKQEITEKNTFSLDRWEVFKKQMKKIIFLSNFFPQQDLFEEIHRIEKMNKIEFKHHLKNPLLMRTLIMKNKNYKELRYLFLSMVFNLALVIFIVMSRFTGDVFIDRKVLYSDKILNLPIFINFGMMLFSNYLFLFFNQIWGYPIVMSVCYYFLFVISLVHGIEILSKNLNRDLKVFNSVVMEEYIKNEQYEIVRRAIFMSSFLVHGLFFPLHLYITRLSLTVSRNTFYGFLQCIIYTLWMLSVPLTRYFDTNILFITKCSLIGFLISYFVVKQDDGTIVKDFRILEKDNTKKD